MRLLKNFVEVLVLVQGYCKKEKKKEKNHWEWQLSAGII